jgi:hypothetical protein
MSRLCRPPNHDIRQSDNFREFFRNCAFRRKNTGGEPAFFYVTVKQTIRLAIITSDGAKTLWIFVRVHSTMESTWKKNKA